MFKNKDYGSELDRDIAAYILKFTTTTERGIIATTRYSTVEKVLSGLRNLTETNSSIIEAVAFKASDNNEKNEKIDKGLQTARRRIVVCKIAKLAAGK